MSAEPQTTEIEEAISWLAEKVKYCYDAKDFDEAKDFIKIMKIIERFK